LCAGACGKPHESAALGLLAAALALHGNLNHMAAMAEQLNQVSLSVTLWYVADE